MKIAMVVRDLTVSGGYQKLVLRLALELEKHGHVTVIYTPSVDTKACYPEMIEKVSIVALRQSPTPMQESSLLKKIGIIIKGPLEMISDFKALANKMPRDTEGVIVHDPPSMYTLPYFYPQKKIKTVWMANNQIPDNFGSFRGALAELQLGSPLKGLVIALLSAPGLIAATLIRKSAIKKIDEFATYDSFNQELVKKFLHRKATLVYAGADLVGFKDLSSGRKPSKNKIHKVLSVGVLFPYRRYEDLILAASELAKQGTKLRVDIVGSSLYSADYHRHLNELLNKEKLGDVVFLHEVVSSRQMHALYKEADAFVFVNDANTWGIAVFEAVAAGLPVVITNNIGAADLVKPGQHGWVVNPKKSSEIAVALTEIFTKPALVKERTTAASKEILPMISWEAFTNRMLDLLGAKHGQA